MKAKGKKAWEGERLRKDRGLISRWCWKGCRVGGREEAWGEAAMAAKPSIHSVDTK